MSTVESYSVIKRNEILIYDTLWMGLEDTTLSEIRQTQNHKYVTPLVRGTYHRQIHGGRRWSRVSSGCEEEKRGPVVS